MRETLLTFVALSRLLACFPCAVGVSFASAVASMTVFRTWGHYGSWPHDVWTLAPLAVNTAIPAVVFVLTGAFVAPSVRRPVCFVFFVLALFFSGGGIHLLMSGSGPTPDYVDWGTAYVGIAIGALIGLGLALRLQNVRSRWSMKAQERREMSETVSPKPSPRSDRSL